MQVHLPPTDLELRVRQSPVGIPDESIFDADDMIWRQIKDVLKYRDKDSCDEILFHRIQALASKASPKFRDVLAKDWLRNSHCGEMLRFNLVPKTDVLSVIKMMEPRFQTLWLNYCTKIGYIDMTPAPMPTIAPQSVARIAARKSSKIHRPLFGDIWPTIKSYLMANDDNCFDQIEADITRMLVPVAYNSLRSLIESRSAPDDLRLLLRAGLASKAGIAFDTISRLPIEERVLWAAYGNTMS